MGRRLAAASTAIFAAVGLLVAVDLIGDASAGSDLRHLAVEAIVLVVSLVGVAYLGWALLDTRRDVDQLTAEVARWQEAAEVWRNEARGLLDGLGAAIDRQFSDWALSDAERDVGLLLVKGLSLKEIAGIRETSERTVRQQAQSIYRKSGVAGRAELSAFFLEDLLLPRANREPDASSRVGSQDTRDGEGV